MALSIVWLPILEVLLPVNIQSKITLFVIFHMMQVGNKMNRWCDVFYCKEEQLSTCLAPHLCKTANIKNVVTDKILKVVRHWLVSSR